MKKEKLRERKIYLKPSASSLYIDSDSYLLTGSPDTDFKPHVVPPTDEDGDDDDDIEG